MELSGGSLEGDGLKIVKWLFYMSAKLSRLLQRVIRLSYVHKLTTYFLISRQLSGYMNLTFSLKVKVSKSQKHFYLKLQITNEILDKILSYQARAEFCPIFRLFFLAMKFQEKMFLRFTDL